MRIVVRGEDEKIDCCLDGGVFVAVSQSGSLRSDSPEGVIDK